MECFKKNNKIVILLLLFISITSIFSLFFTVKEESLFENQDLSQKKWNCISSASNGDINNYIVQTDNNYDWIDASGGVELFLGDDDSELVSLPFNFPFYNGSFSSVYISSNGYLSFTDNSPTDYTEDSLPSTDIDNSYLIAPFWDDLYPNSEGHIYHQSFGDHWVISWEDIDHFLSDYPIGTFQVVLYRSGKIVFNYDYLNYTSDGYTCGLNLGLDTRYFNSYQGLTESTDNFSILFIPRPFFDDFERGTLTPNWNILGSGGAGVSSNTSYSGSYSAYHNGGSGAIESTTIPLNGTQNLYISFWIRRGDSSFSERPDSNEDLIVEYYSNSSTWTILTTYLGNGTSGEIYTYNNPVPSDAYHSNFKIRFNQTSATGTEYDYWHIDDVKVGESTTFYISEAPLIDFKLLTTIIIGVSIPSVICITLLIVFLVWRKNLKPSQVEIGIDGWTPKQSKTDGAYIRENRRTTQNIQDTKSIDTKKICPYCGAISKSPTFCTNCGTKLTD